MRYRATFKYGREVIWEKEVTSVAAMAKTGLIVYQTEPGGGWKNSHCKIGHGTLEMKPANQPFPKLVEQLEPRD